MGGVDCSVTAATTTSITCDVGNGPIGTYPVIVNVDGKGLSTGSETFTYTADISSVSPSSGSLGGKRINAAIQCFFFLGIWNLNPSNVCQNEFWLYRVEGHIVY